MIRHSEEAIHGDYDSRTGHCQAHFRAHAADAAGNAVLRKKLRQEEVHAFFASLPPCLVGMEACATAHYWAREIAALGHDARLIPPIYVKAYVVRQKNDFVDAAAICEAVTRPSVRQTPVKTVEQQAARVTQRAHELLSRQRVTLINALRGHMAEFGILAPAGPQHVGRLIEKLADPTAPIPSAVRDALNVLADQLVALGREIDQMEAQMRRTCRSEENAARLLTIPGVGPITASAIIAGVPNIHGFRSGRDFAAHGSAWCRGKTQAAGRNALEGSPRWAIGRYDACWSQTLFRRSDGAVVNLAFRKAGSEG